MDDTHSRPAGTVIVGTVAVRPDARPRVDAVTAALAAGTRTQPGRVGFAWGGAAGERPDVTAASARADTERSEVVA